MELSAKIIANSTSTKTVAAVEDAAPKEKVRTIKRDIVKKHIDIKINNRKVKILGYKRSSYFDKYENRDIPTIELVTKMYNEVLDDKVVEIDLHEKEVLRAEFVYGLRRPGLYRFTFKIIDRSILSESNEE